MKILDSSPSFITPPHKKAVESFGESPIVCDETEVFAANWEKIINKLLEWGPNSFDDDEIISPKLEVLTLALKLAVYLRDKGLVAPGRVMPDTDGGIVFERKLDGTTEMLTIGPDLSVEHLLFREGELFERQIFDDINEDE